MSRDGNHHRPGARTRVSELDAPARSAPGKRTLTEALASPPVAPATAAPAVQMRSGEEVPPSTVCDVATHAAPRATLQQLFARRDARGAAHTRTAGAAASATSEQVTEAGTTDRQTTETPAVQLRSSEGARDVAEVHAAAARGTHTPASPLPHGEAIRRSFGDHDVSQIQAHTGSEAAASTRAMGAEAFATGDHVVFAGAPSLHTAAHEAAHVIQQRGGVQLKGGVGAAGDAYEQHADAVADAVVAGRSAEGLLEQMPGGGQRGPAMQHAPMIQLEPSKTMDRARYHAIELELKNLVSQKKDLVNGTGKGDMAAIDAAIDKLIAELRVDFGVQMDRGKVLDDAVAGKDMLVVDGRIVLSSSGGNRYMGERLGAKLEMDHVPPGETLQIGWRWRTPESGQTYRFLVGGPAFGEKTVTQEMALDTPFWGLVPPAVEKAQGLEIVAEVYIGKTSHPTKTFSTGFISMPERPVGDVKLVGASERVVKDSFVELGIGPWTPDFRRYSIDWFVDNVQVAADQLALRHPYDKLGKHVTRADIYRVQRSFGIRDKQLIRSATTSFEVLTDEQYGNKFLTELETSPFRPKPVGVHDLLTSGDHSLDELQHRIDQGGNQQSYWKDRQEAQKERLAKVREFAPDHATAKPIPSDPTKLEAGGSYSGPVTAALVMSSGGGAQPLTLHLTIYDVGGVWQARLIDSTSKKVLKADGSGATPLAAYTAVFETWRTDNEYPTGGHVVHRFAPPSWTLGGSFSTTTPWKRAKDWVDGILQVGGFLVGMLLLADPDPTISKLLGGLLMAAVVARSSVAIYERIRNGGDVLSTENVLDAVAIATSFVGIGGGALRSIGVTARSPLTYRVGNWMIMSAVAGDAGTFLYASAEAIASLRTIQADPTMDDSQKSGELLRIMGSLFLSGALLIATNRELFRNGIKPHDFVKSDLSPGMKPELDVGARLDAEYELKKGGQWSKETAKLSDEAVLDKVFTQRSRQSLEADLAKKIGAKPAAALADALGNDAFVQLHHMLGEDAMTALAKDIGPAKVGELHKELGTSDFGALAKDLGVAGIKTLLDRVPAAEIKKLMAELGATVLKHLTSGAASLHGDEVVVLVKQHGHTAVKWAGDTLDGATAKALLESVKPDTLKGLQDVSAADAHTLVGTFGRATVEGAVPPVTGKQLNTERLQLGDKTAQGVADEKVKKHKPDDLAKHADLLDAATRHAPAPLQGDSLIVDSNVLAGVKEVIDGMAWRDLQAHKKNGINLLRSRAKPPLPPLSNDPTTRDIEGVIGKGHDLRVANVTLGESAPHPGLEQKGFELTASRDSQQYNNVLAELAKEPAIGKNKGFADRAIVADAVFANGSGKPVFMSGDRRITARLFERFGPGKANPIKQLPDEDVVRAIVRTHPAGFDADIPNGAGGIRIITVVPMI